jgi:hypothetical protein
MEDRGTARMRKYGESKTTRIMMATVPYVISGLGLRKFQADGFLLTRVYNRKLHDDGQRRCPKHVEFYNRINLDN